MNYKKDERCEHCGNVIKFVLNNECIVGRHRVLEKVVCGVCFKYFKEKNKLPDKALEDKKISKYDEGKIILKNARVIDMANWRKTQALTEKSFLLTMPIKELFEHLNIK